MLPTFRNAVKQILRNAALPNAEQTIPALRELLLGLEPSIGSSCKAQLRSYTSGSVRQIRDASNAVTPHTAGVQTGTPQQPRQGSTGHSRASSSGASSAEISQLPVSVQTGSTASAMHTSSAAAAAPEEAAAAEETSSSVAAPVPPGRVQNSPPPPWTPTQQLKKRNFLPRRMGHLMQVLEQEAADKAASERKYPDFKPGDILELKLVVPENKGRPATVKGLCIAKKNRGWRTAFTILNYIQGGGPVERTFPLYSPTLQGLSVIGSRKVRRAKLYYLRDRKPNEYRA